MRKGNLTKMIFWLAFGGHALLPFENALARHYDLETLGNTWEIIEPDALEEIEARAAGVDWESQIKEQRDELVENYRPRKPQGAVQEGRAGGWLADPLPMAEKEATYLVDMTYTLEMDVPDGKGGILYPKGYTFNPLDFVSYPNPIVVIDGESPEQVHWFMQSPYAADPTVKLLLNRGSWQQLGETFQRPVQYLTEKIAERLQITAVPSVISQSGNMMQVHQIYVDPEQSLGTEAPNSVQDLQ